MKSTSSKLLLAVYLCLALGLGLLFLFNPLDGEPKGELLQFFGRLHPALLHLPFGIVLLLALVELLPRDQYSKLESVIPLALWVAIVTSLIAITTGTLLAMGEGANEPLVISHMRDGILFALVLIGLGVVRLVRLDSKLLYRAGLAASVVLLVMASHQGGSLTHGSGYLTKYMPNGMRPIFGLAKVEERKVATRDDLIVFKDLIQPLVEQNCLSCHNPDKLKGELNLETYEGHLAGGEIGPAVVPGDLDESEMYFRLTLPQSDEEAMPPEEKPPLGEDEIALVAWWIEQGASATATVAAYDEIPGKVDTYIASVFSRMVSPAELKRLEEERVELYASLGELKEELGVLIIPTERDARQFILEAFAVQKRFGDSELRALKPFAATFVAADLSRTQITDAAVEMLAGFENLRSLNLSRTVLSGRELGRLSGLENLETLNLYGSKVGPEHMPELVKLSQLKKLYLFQTEFEDSDRLSELRASLPDCEIVAMR